MIRFDNVSKVYPGGGTAVKGLHLEVEPGEFVCLIGPSGCGKTTTLKMINRLQEPTSGTIYVSGKDIMKQDPVQLRRGIGYVIQQIGLFPNMTIGENIAVVLKLLGWPKEKRRQRVDDLLPLVGMDADQYRDRYPGQLSGGQQQRVGVLRALAAQPDLILMDEPFGALDPITRDILQAEVKQLQVKLSKTIVFVTHDMEEALKLADRIVLMKDGTILQHGTPDDLLKRPADEFVERFMGRYRPKEETADAGIRELMLPLGGRDASRPDPERCPSIEAGCTVQEAMRTMFVADAALLTVRDESGRPVGLLTRERLVERLNREQGQEQNQDQEQIS